MYGINALIQDSVMLARIEASRTNNIEFQDRIYKISYGYLNNFSHALDKEGVSFDEFLHELKNSEHCKVFLDRLEKREDFTRLVDTILGICNERVVADYWLHVRTGLFSKGL